MEFNKYINKTDELGHIETEIVARNATLSIIANILNAFLSIHSMSTPELQALQGAINRENATIDELAQKVFSAFSEKAIPSDEIEAENLDGTFGAEDATIEEVAKTEAPAETVEEAPASVEEVTDTD